MRETLTDLGELVWNYNLDDFKCYWNGAWPHTA